MRLSFDTKDSSTKGMGSSGGDLTRQKLCFVKRKRYLAKPNLDLGARAVVSFPNPR